MSTDRRHRASSFGAFGFFVVALGCAALAAFTASRMLDAKGYTGDRVKPIVVAKRALSPAQAITPDDVMLVDWPEKSLPPGAVSDPAVLFAENAKPVPNGAILEGEPVLPAKLANKQSGTALAALVTDGYRAVAVKVDDSVGRSGLVYPGARVDVLATIRDPEGRGPSTRIAVENARVLAVESETDVATRRPRPEGSENSGSQSTLAGTVVTLEVLPEDAEVVSLASREGQVDLALRSGSDTKPVETRGATPVMFSAFAPELTVDPVTGQPVLGTAPTAPAASDSGSSSSRRGRSRKTELRALTSERSGGSPREIETYNAR
jgi:pilus assembly protein CpaB